MVHARPALAIRLLLALVAALLAGCGDSGPETPRAKSPEDASPDWEAAEAERQQSARAELATVRSLLDHDKIPEAYAAIRRAAALIGETTDVVRVRDRVRQHEKKLSEDREYREALEAMNRDTSAASEEERLRFLALAEEKAKTFLAKYPDSPHVEEIEAGLEYAEGELTLMRAYVEAVRTARAHLAAERHEECVAACKQALKAMERPEPRELLDLALGTLTPEGMVYVASGYFKSGADRTRTHVPGFYIDRTEVTNAQYHAFVTATGHPPPQRFENGAPRTGEEDRPVTYVTLADALAYARWAKKRLPTELEWERAARGKDGRIYPWGNEWDPKKGHFGSGGTRPVGSMPFDRSPDGVMDMGGNVMEMTLPLDDLKGERSGPVMKGGHWSDDFHPEYATAFARYHQDREHMGSGSGFRCVRSMP